MTHELEERDGEIAPVWSPVPARGTPTVSKVKCSPLRLEASMNLPNSKVRMGLDVMVILNERQPQKWTLEREMKATKAAWHGTKLYRP